MHFAANPARLSSDEMAKDSRYLLPLLYTTEYLIYVHFIISLEFERTTFEIKLQ